MRLALALGLLLLAGCTGPTSPPAGPGTGGTSTGGGGNATSPDATAAGPVAFEHLDGCGASQASEQQAVARSKADFDALWQRSCGPNPEPDVDFTARTVLAYFWGEKRTGGYSAEVAGVTDDGSKLEVRVTRDAPGPGCATAQVVTYPADLVTVPATQEPVVFTFVDRTYPC